MSALIVPDANLFIKQLVSEVDSHLAFDFFRACIDRQLLAPELLRYEVMQVAYAKGCDFEVVYHLISSYESNHLVLKQPTENEWRIACEIIDNSHPKSGFPSMHDAIYHAIAVANNGLFVTADKRHYEKTRRFGHIALLSEWEQSE